MADMEPVKKEQETRNKVQKVNATYLNVRVRPDLDSPILRVIKKGSTVTILDTLNDGWLRIKNSKGKEGFAQESYITNE